MARKVSKVEEQAPGAQDQNRDQAQYEPPWYQYTDWWEGMSSAQVAAKIEEWRRDTKPGSWIVVPQEYLSRSKPKHVPSSDELLEAVRRMPSAVIEPVTLIPPCSTGISKLAWEIYMELTRTKGYSPSHAANAWVGARAFLAEGERTQNPEPADGNS